MQLARRRGAAQKNPPFNLLQRAVRHPSQCSQMLVCDDCLPVALFLSMIVRDICSRTLARHEMRDSNTPTRLAKALLRAARPEPGAVKPVQKNAERIRGR